MEQFNYIIQYVLNVFKNTYIIWIMFYILYLIIVFYIFFPICKKFLLPFINKTKTNIDNEIYWKIRYILKILLALIWINIVYNLYLINLLSSYYKILYKFLLTLELVLIYIISNRITKIIVKYLINKFQWIITKNIANFVKLVVDIFIFSIITLLVLKTWWINITPLLASAGIFWLAVAMASKSIIENFLSWLILFADKSINVWDIVILSDWSVASVEEINIRTTRLKTFDWNIIIIPNSELLNEKIVNKSLSDISNKKRVQVTVWISYWDDVNKAKELLKKYLLELDWADENSVVVYLDELADWSVNITWKIMVDSNKRSYLLEKYILEKVYNSFPDAGLNFPFPTYELTWNLNSK